MGHSSIGYGVPSFRVWCSSACMFFPSNSAGWAYPSSRAAEGLEKRQIPCESQPQIASEAESSIRRFSSLLLSRMSSACTRNVLSSENGMVDLGKKKRCYAVGSDGCLSAFAKHLGYHYIEWTISFRKDARTILSGMAITLTRDECTGNLRPPADSTLSDRATSLLGESAS